MNAFSTWKSDILEGQRAKDADKYSEGMIDMPE